MPDPPALIGPGMRCPGRIPCPRIPSGPRRVHEVGHFGTPLLQLVTDEAARGVRRMDERQRHQHPESIPTRPRSSCPLPLTSGPGSGVPDIAMSATNYFVRVDTSEGSSGGTSAVARLMLSLWHSSTGGAEECQFPEPVPLSQRRLWGRTRRHEWNEMQSCGHSRDTLQAPAGSVHRPRDPRWSTDAQPSIAKTPPTSSGERCRCPRSHGPMASRGSAKRFDTNGGRSRRR